MREHRRRIFCAEADQVHYIRRQPVTRNETGIVWIADQHKPGLQPVHEPVRIEGRDICTHSCIDDHDISSRITRAESPLIRTDCSRISSGTRSSSMFRQA